MSIEPKTGTVKSHDGLHLFYRLYAASDSPRAIIAYFHGGGGHSGQPTYTHFLKHFMEKGYALYGLDQRGHGYSEGARYHTDTQADIRQDMRHFLEMIQQAHPNKPVFFLGQSMGGLFVLDYCLHRPKDVAGAIAIASGLNLTGIPAVVRLLFRAMNWIAPKRVLKVSGVDLTAASRDPVEAERIKEDKLTNLAGTPRGFVQIIETMKRVHANAPNFDTPLMVIHGKGDRISPYVGSETFFNAVTMADKTLKLYEDGYHQPFIDTNREEVFADIENWIEGQLSVSN